jgi:hypothetical protein
MHNPSVEAAAPERLLIEAIATRRMIAADYNAQRIRLAVHLLFERRGELFAGALNPAKNRRSDEPPTLGYFKLKGLSNLALADERFEPLENAGNLPREEDVLVFGV